MVQVQSEHLSLQRHMLFYLQVQTEAYFSMNLLLRGACGTSLKTSATDLTWRQSLNECGSAIFYATFHLVLPLCFQKGRLLQDLKTHTHTHARVHAHTSLWHSTRNRPQSWHSLLAHSMLTVGGGHVRHCRAGKYRPSQHMGRMDLY